MQTKVEIKHLPHSEVEISGEVEAQKFESFRKAATTELGNNLKVDGFRPGRVPREVVVKKLSPERILEAMAELALREIYPIILREHKIDALGGPQITITKLAPGNPLGFKIKVAIHPTVTLPDYRAIAQKNNAEPVESSEVTDEEIATVVAQIKKDLGGEITPDKLQKIGEIKDEADLRVKIRTGLAESKKQKIEDKKRIRLVEAIGAETKLELPELLIQSELGRMLGETKKWLEQIKLPYADYLRQIKKSEEELRASWREPAIARVKGGLIIEAIAQKEKIEFEKVFDFLESIK